MAEKNRHFVFVFVSRLFLPVLLWYLVVHCLGSRLVLSCVVLLCYAIVLFCSLLCCVALSCIFSELCCVVLHLIVLFLVMISSLLTSWCCYCIDVVLCCVGLFLILSLVRRSYHSLILQFYSQPTLKPKNHNAPILKLTS
jgi:hypothetical protein